MVLSEAEAEARLAALRRERESLDRAIADLSLYLELGRRLTGAPLDPGLSGATRPAGKAAPATAAPDPGRPDPASARAAAPAPSGGTADDAPGTAVRLPGLGHRAGEAEPGAAASETKGGGLSEGVLARRYGRALIEAALSALEEAGRPLHASEILAVLAARGFALSGRDPVAALNTRLWKRSGPDGPFRRLGDAVYALAEAEDAEER